MSRVNKKAFGEYIRNKRIELGLTQEELASRLNVSSMTISKWENGRRYPDFEMIDDISEAFQVSVEEIFENSKGEEASHIHFSTGIIALVLIVGIIGITGVLKTNKPKKTVESMLSYQLYCKDGNRMEPFVYCRIKDENTIVFGPNIASSSIWEKEYDYEIEGDTIKLKKSDKISAFGDYSGLENEFTMEIIGKDKFLLNGNVYMPCNDWEYSLSNGVYINKDDELCPYIDINNNEAMISDSLMMSYASHYIFTRKNNVLFLTPVNGDGEDIVIEIVDDNTLKYKERIYKYTPEVY